MKSKLTVY